MLSEMFGKSSNFSIRDVKRLKIVRNERYFNTIIATINHGNRFNSLITTNALSARETLRRRRFWKTCDTLSMVSEDILHKRK